MNLNLVDVSGCGILYQEIIVTALAEYERQMLSLQNHCRAQVVRSIIDKLNFV